MLKLLRAFLLLFPGILFSQQVQTFPLSPAYDAGRQILPTLDGGYVLFGDRAVSAANPRRDLSLVKVSAAGTQVWQRNFGDATLNESAGQGISAVGDGWLLAGTRTDATGKNLGYLVLVNSVGTATWTKQINLAGVNNLVINDIDIIADNGFIATGSVGTGTQMQMIAIRILSDGTVEWHKIYSTGTGRGILVTNGGGNGFIAGGSKIWRIRTSNGDLVWEQKVSVPAFGSVGATVNIELNDIAAMTGKQLAVIGTITSVAVPASGSAAAYLLTTWTQGGDFLWQNTFHRTAVSATITVDGSAVAYHGSSKEIIMAGTVAGRLTVTRLKQTGTLISTWQPPTTGTTAGQYFSPSISRYSGFYAFTAGIQTANSTTGVNTFFYRTASNFLGIPAPGTGTGILAGNDKLKTTAESLVISPNPTSGLTYLRWEMEQEQTMEWRLMDLQGRLVATYAVEAHRGVNEMEIDLQELPQGAYILMVPSLKGMVRQLLKNQ